MTEDKWQRAEDKEEGIGANALRGTNPPRAARNEPKVRFGSRRRGAGGGGDEGGAARNKPTSAGVAAQNEPNPAPGPTRTNRTHGPGAERTEGASAGDARGPADRDSERTERGNGRPGRAVRAKGRDSERTERRAGGCGQDLPRGRGGAERTEGGGPTPKTNPISGVGAAKTNPISGGARGRGPGVGEGGRGGDRDEAAVPRAGAERTDGADSFTSATGRGTLTPALSRGERGEEGRRGTNRRTPATGPGQAAVSQWRMRWSSPDQSVPVRRRP
jgi:hypothetical protein